MADGPTTRGLVAELASELLGERMPITRRLVQAVHSSPAVPGDEDLRTATAEAGAQVVLQLLTQLRDGVDMATTTPPPAAIAYAQEFAHRGIELSVLLAVVRSGYSEFAALWARRLSSEIPPTQASVDALSSSLLDIFAYVDSISTAFAVVYSEERARWSRSVEALRLDLVRAIIDGQPVDQGLASRRLGQRLDVRHRAFVVWSDGDPAEGRRGALEAATAELAERAGASHALVVPLSGQLLAAWISGPPADCDESALCSDRLASAGSSHVRAACGLAAAGVQGFRLSHRQALHARRVARAEVRSAGEVTPYSEVALAALLTADFEHAREFACDELGALASKDPATERIAHTVRVFLDEGRSRVRTSRRLGLHTNTVAYRLARGADLLGHALDQRAAEVQAALMILPMLDSAPPDANDR